MPRIKLIDVSKTYHVPVKHRPRLRGLGARVKAMKRLIKRPETEPRQVVKKVNLEVRHGELLALLGGSGSGKTTTLKMINRLIEPDRDGGKILVDGQDVATRDPVELRRTIGYVIQGSGLFPHLSVAGNVAVVLRLLGRKKDEIDERVNQLLELVRLSPLEYRDRMPEKTVRRAEAARRLRSRPGGPAQDHPPGRAVRGPGPRHAGAIAGGLPHHLQGGTVDGGHGNP